MYRLPWINVCTWKILSTHTQKLPIPRPPFTLLYIMNIHTRANVLVRFWYLESVGYINQTEKAARCVLYRLTWSTHKMLILTHTEVTNAMSTVYTTLDYEYRHKNKGTGLILVPRKCWVYKSDQESQKTCTVPVNMKYTQNAHPHIHRSHQCHAMPCPLFTPL